MRPDDRTQARRSLRLTGAGALTFAAVLVIQNLVHATTPLPGASAADVTSYFGAHHGSFAVMLVLLPVGMIGLFLFVSGLLNRILDGGPLARHWGLLGAIGGTLIGALFLVSNVFEIAIIADSQGLAAQPAIAQALWALQNGAFAINLGAIAIAFWGLGFGAYRAGIAPRWTIYLAAVGAVLLLVGSGGALSIVEGSPLFALSLLGFLCWLAWVATTGVRLLRLRPLTAEVSGATPAIGQVSNP